MVTEAPVRTIGKYVIERELGRGAHGVVYRAHPQDQPDTPVALKLVESRGSVDKLLLEPAMLSRLDHPCIVRVEDYFLRDDQLVLALEFIEGEDLKTLLDRGETFSQAMVRELLVQMASALAEAHGKNVIHRDLKPSNILVVHQDGRLRFVLTDFGVGQVAEGIQVTKHVAGTYSFMAPEQLRGRPGPQSDLWALGVVAYRLLTGKMPFPGPTLRELSNQILYATPAPPSQCCADVLDPQLEAAAMRLLDKSLQERTGSAEELLRELGHKGPVAKILQRNAARRRTEIARISLDQRLTLAIRRRWWLLAGCTVLYFVDSGIINTTLMLAGMVLFYLAQREDLWRRSTIRWATLFSLVLLAGHFTIHQFYLEHDHTLISIPSTVFLGAVIFLILLFLPGVAAACYASIRRVQREQALRTIALESGTNSIRYLDLLRHMVDTRFEDVGFHLKYAEALFARGLLREAAVEARLLLKQDPYHFNGSLLLANAYLALGLKDDCLAVCDQYLEVSGYCFEFSELREQCQRRSGKS